MFFSSNDRIMTGMDFSYHYLERRYNLSSKSFLYRCYIRLTYKFKREYLFYYTDNKNGSKTPRIIDESTFKEVLAILYDHNINARYEIKERVYGELISHLDQYVRFHFKDESDLMNFILLVE